MSVSDRSSAQSSNEASAKEYRASTDDIASYYDKNTRHFLALGGSGDVAAIHRAIWAPGVTDKNAAFNFLNQVVADAILAVCNKQPGPEQPGQEPPGKQQPGQTQAGHTRVLDLGCGVGGTSTWLARTLGVDVTGVTISQEQQRQANQRALQLNLQDQCRFMQGDFAAMPEIAPVDAAFAIESFVHARDAASFFNMAANLIKPGGRLIICDDFLAPGKHQPAADFWVKRFRRGWHLNNLVTAAEADSSAQAFGFRQAESSDLSAFTRPFHPLLLGAVSQLTRLPLPWAYWHNLAGGTALQICLKRGWTRYQVLVWDKLP